MVLSKRVRDTHLATSSEGLLCKSGKGALSPRHFNDIYWKIAKYLYKQDYRVKDAL